MFAYNKTRMRNTHRVACSASNTQDEGKYHAMTKKGLPLGFMAALAEDKRAMQNFARMNEKEQEAILARARAAKWKADMQLIVMSLADDTSATEYH